MKARAWLKVGLLGGAFLLSVYNYCDPAVMPSAPQEDHSCCPLEKPSKSDQSKKKSGRCSCCTLERTAPQTDQVRIVSPQDFQRLAAITLQVQAELPAMSRLTQDFRKNSGPPQWDFSASLSRAPPLA